MASSPFLSSLLSHLRLNTRTRNSSCARVFSADTPSPCEAFEADLAASLQKLTHGDISSSDLISCNWISKALDVVISSQTSAKKALHTHTTSSSAVYSDKDRVSKMMEQYMEDSVKMLDVCCLLKGCLAGVNAYVKASHLALKRVQGSKLVNQGDIQRAKHALLSARNVQETLLLPGASVRTNVKNGESTKRLSACSSMLRRMGDKLPAPLGPSEPLYLNQEPANTASMASSALYGGEMCTLFFLRLLSTALSSPASSPRKSSSLITPLHMSGQAAAWVPSLLSLQEQLNSELLQIAAQRRTQRCFTLLPELHILEASMNQISETLVAEFSSKQARDDLKHLVDSTSMLTHRLQSSMARLQHQIDCIFSSLMDTSMTMLE